MLTLIVAWKLLITSRKDFPSWKVLFLKPVMIRAGNFGKATFINNPNEVFTIIHLCAFNLSLVGVVLYLLVIGR